MRFSLKAMVTLRLLRCCITCALAAFTLAACVGADYKNQPPAPQIPSEQAQIERILQGLSLEQKVGQMTMLAAYIFFDTDANGQPVLNAAKLDKALNQYHVGTFINSPANLYSTSQWQRWIDTLNQANSSHQIPVLIGTDSMHGASFVKDAVLLPQNISLAAIRDTQAAQIAASITAKETAAAGILWNFGPVLDVGRHPLWPRLEETFGEDPYLVSQYGATMIQVFEAMGMASTMKHFIGYSVPLDGKDRAPAYLPDVQLWQDHIPPFKAAIAAGASTAMVNSASINGMPTHANAALLQGVLREQLGYRGLIVSDWADINYLHTRHKVAPSKKHAVEMAVNAGIDMSMVATEFSFPELLVALVKEGRISERRIDDSVRRILALKIKLGLFNQLMPAHWVQQQSSAATLRAEKAAHKQHALALANKSMTLLKNDKRTLPLPAGAKVLLAGPAAKSLHALNGSWSFSWQGDDDSLYPSETQTLHQALQQHLGAGNVIHQGEADFYAPANVDVASVKRFAPKVDYIVLALGEGAYAEQMGSIDDLTLAKDQLQLAQAAIATGKPVIALFTMGRPRIIAPIVDGLAAILYAYRPGSQGAQAIAQTLLGLNNPAGVLPFSYPQYTGNLLTYDHPISAAIRQRPKSSAGMDGYAPQWPFGFGLSYTDFAISNLSVSGEDGLAQSEFKAGDTLTVSVQVKNTGQHAGEKVIELYIKDHFASLTPANKRLKRFTRIALAAGEQRTVAFTLTVDDFAFVNGALALTAEPGVFTVEAGGLTTDVVLLE
ncbi:glycoside hydrolase family 3 N-terminal domain-containing protein [Marinagarivorans cellulosilyticus]|uniref:beta-glucosidase n=1 Tax=Marinagarivorans cellulosilyticus TaxID=2721545 RepID=A0AAN1WHR7_9GAMM|nr:glycoside hydrolase family 3 N-terminal domain-containing protein [Marinagarivorans cellulosilyticus]BCD97840.1 beta-glucosidase [Marinagarivorans cellulosilyticus]